MLRGILTLLALLLVGALGALYLLGSGALGRHRGPGEVTRARIPAEVVAQRSAARQTADKQILFGDLHVHTTFSFDAFLLGMPLAQGEGAHPPADAYDFACFCSALDFWSINDHALTLTPQNWRETVSSIRQCNAVAGDDPDPDVVAFLGWEWTQMGTTPDDHYGHKNVILADTETSRIPARPIAARLPGPPPAGLPSAFRMGLLPLRGRDPAYLDLVTYLRERGAVKSCPEELPLGERPDDCRDSAATPEELFAKLDEWGHRALVIPHGTTWGFYTPLGSSWDKQLSRRQHDPERQRLIEVFSGHGNSEEYRPWREVTFAADGARSCPEPAHGYRPSCWRAGQIVRARCQQAGEARDECERRAVLARQRYVDADISGHLTVPGAATGEWLDSGQCSDCFQPSFRYRPRGSVQYILALSGFDEAGDLGRFRFGLMAASDNHSARPGTGYKEYGRWTMTESGFRTLAGGLLGGRPAPVEPAAHSVPFDRGGSSTRFFAVRETERSASFFVTGGLTAVHASGRSRGQIWDALERKEVYGTSGPRILLWFDLKNGGRRLPMGGEVSMLEAPVFEVRAVGSFEQKPGCPDYALGALSPERLERLCRGECYHPGDTRRPITRLEVVRIRPQARPGEPVDALIEDPWRVLPCAPDPAGCRASFVDDEFVAAARDTVYYVRAIEAPSLAVNADNLRCERDASGRCLRTHACQNVPRGDDCLAMTEERAWSSPIFVDYPR